jgi:hypothetical protein
VLRVALSRARSRRKGDEDKTTGGTARAENFPLENIRQLNLDGSPKKSRVSCPERGGVRRYAPRRDLLSNSDN